MGSPERAKRAAERARDCRRREQREVKQVGRVGRFPAGHPVYAALARQWESTHAR